MRGERDIPEGPVIRSTTIPPASRLLIRQGGASDLEGVLRICETHAQYWDGRLPTELRLSQFFARALSSQDDVFQFWVAENGHGSMVGWEMLSAATVDPVSRRLKAEATTCLAKQSSGLGRMLATHAIRHAARTPLQYLFARVPTRDTLMIGVLEAVGYQEVGLIPAATKAPARPEQLEFVYVVDA
jgi:L-amino acid N-acyltransferase YncA